MRALQVIAVANDITFNSGAFGTREDAVFRAATEHALEERLPLVYLAANAGARVGLASEVKQCLQVCVADRRPVLSPPSVCRQRLPSAAPNTDVGVFHGATGACWRRRVGETGSSA